MTFCYIVNFVTYEKTNKQKKLTYKEIPENNSAKSQHHMNYFLQCQQFSLFSLILQCNQSLPNTYEYTYIRKIIVTHKKGF